MRVIVFVKSVFDVCLIPFFYKIFKYVVTLRLPRYGISNGFER